MAGASLPGSAQLTFRGPGEAFLEDDLIAREPITLFGNWFDTAAKTEGIQEPTAMSLATATRDGCPSCRMVLMKSWGTEGFKFCTNYESRKGGEMEENPNVALNFYWAPLHRCIRIEGRIEKLGSTESTQLFHARPLGSQISAAISPQSQAIPGRNFLLEKEAQLRDKIGDKACVARPENWGGYLVIPERMEFWQGQTNRMHDRIQFRKRRLDDRVDGVVLHAGENGWVFERLAP